MELHGQISRVFASIIVRKYFINFPRIPNASDFTLARCRYCHFDRLGNRKEKVSPLEIREIVYQCAPYVGIGRVQETMEGVNDAFKKAHIPLPLPTATTVTDKNRREAGEQMVMKLNGDRMKQILSQVAKDEYDLRVNDLYDFCFGDFYTRSGLSLKDRELVVFGAIAALGGCEAQLRSHIGANLREGTTKAQLVDALRVMLPYLGFPRTLNAMNQVTQLTKDSK